MQQLKINVSITRRSSELDAYLKEIARYPMLTPDEEVELSDRIRQGDVKAKQRLVEANLRFVVSVAKQYQNTGIRLIDAIQDGNIGLMKAAEMFDGTRGFKFISYAVWWIRQSILQGMSENSRMVRMPLNQIGIMNKICKATVDYEQEHNRIPNEYELAEILDLPVEKVMRVLNVVGKPTSLDAPLLTDSESCLMDVVEDTDTEKTDYTAECESFSQDIQRALHLLKDRDRQVIILSYGLDGKGERSLDFIAEEMDLTRERVRQIRERSIKQLRQTSAFETLRKYLA